jgi:hypothetical protein
MSHLNIANWVAFLPILLSVVSFAKFIRDVRKEHDPSFRPFRRNSKFLVALGFAGLAGSVLLVIYGLQADKARQLRERILTGHLITLNDDNASLKASQAKLLQSNGQLMNLVVALHERIEKLESAATEAAETSRRIEDTTTSIAEDAEQNAELGRLQTEAVRQQAEAAKRIANIEEERADQEKRCISYRKLQLETLFKMAGCVGSLDSQETPSKLIPGSEAVEYPQWSYRYPNVTEKRAFPLSNNRTPYAARPRLTVIRCRQFKKAMVAESTSIPGLNPAAFPAFPAPNSLVSC